MAPEEENPEHQSLTMLKAETGIAIFLTVAAAALSLFMPYLIASGGIVAAQTFITLSPIFFPRLAFGILAILCLSYVLQSMRQLSSLSSTSGLDHSDRFLRAGMMMAVAAVYAFLVPTLGYVPSTMIMTAVVSLYLGMRQWVSVTCTAFFTPLVIRCIFQDLLLISLPRSEIPFIANSVDKIMNLVCGLLHVF